MWIRVKGKTATLKTRKPSRLPGTACLDLPTVVDSSHIAKYTFIPNNRCKGGGVLHFGWFVIVASWFAIVAK